MEEKTNKIFKEYTWTLRAYSNIDVHRTFYKSIKENEEITLVCNSKNKIEIITSKGFTFCRIGYGCWEYYYYAIKAGAVFKGYISDIDGKGFFDVHIFQYVRDGYEDPRRIRYTETAYNAGGQKRFYTHYRYKQEINETSKTENRVFILFAILFSLPFTFGIIFQNLFLQGFSALVLLLFIIIGTIQQFIPMNFRDLMLEKQIRKQEYLFREYDKKILQQRREKKQQIEEQHKLEEEKRRIEEEKSRIEEERNAYERERQIEYERTHQHDVAIINSLKKPDKFGNILCPKCCSMVVAKFGYCPKCKTKFELDSSEENNV